jgi:hypothetical protein
MNDLYIGMYEVGAWTNPELEVIARRSFEDLDEEVQDGLLAVVRNAGRTCMGADLDPDLMIELGYNAEDEIKIDFVNFSAVLAKKVWGAYAHVQILGKEVVIHLRWE